MWSRQPRPPQGEIRANDPIDDAYDAWKAADAAARVVERQVSETWERHDRSKGEPPSRELLREAAWLRHVAADKLRCVIGLLRDEGLIQPGATRVRATGRSGPSCSSAE